VKIFHIRWLFQAFVILAFTVPLFADSPRPQCSYSTSVGDDKIFVMLATNVEHDCQSSGDQKRNEAKTLRAKYPSSGLYPKDSTNAIWTADWYSFRVLISPDGKYVIRMGPWASSISNEAFSFLADGKTVKTYSVSEIIRYPSTLPSSVSHFEWEKNSSVNFASGTFEVATLEGGSFTFKVENGEILKQELPILPVSTGLGQPDSFRSSWSLIAGVVSLCLITILLVGWAVLRGRKRSTG